MVGKRGRTFRTVTLSTPYLTGMLLLVAMAPGASAQSGCLKGNLFMAMGVNGTIKVCPEYDSRVPDLQKQLDEIQKTLKGNQASLREVTHSARSLNELGRNVDGDRQVLLLKSFYKELHALTAADQKKAQEQIGALADKLDSLGDLVTQKKEDEKTALQTTEALNGKLGDAIAALDFTRAQQQLDSIQAKLDKIGADTQEIKRTLEEQSAREQKAAEDERKKAADLDNDPNMYTRAQIMPSLSPLDGHIRMMVFFYSRPPLYPPFIDSEFSMAFRTASGAAWRIDAADKQVSAGGELWHLNVNPNDIGDRATICFVAHDKPSGRLKEWNQRYKVTKASSAAMAVNFVPEGDASMRLVDPGPCDGVKEERKETVEASAARALPGHSADDLAKAQMAKVQEQIASMQASASKARPETFARISAEGSRRDHQNGNQWQIKVDTQPFRPGTPLYDAHLQGNLVSASGQVTPLQFSNRQLFVNIETRYSWVQNMGTEAVFCLTAKDPASEKTYRLTQSFSIETGRVYWRDQGGQVPGDQATFVPSRPATLTEASSAPCK